MESGYSYWAENNVFGIDWITYRFSEHLNVTRCTVNDSRRSTIPHCEVLCCCLTRTQRIFPPDRFLILTAIIQPKLPINNSSIIRTCKPIASSGCLHNVSLCPLQNRLLSCEVLPTINKDNSPSTGSPLLL